MGASRGKPKNPRLQAADVLLYVAACQQVKAGSTSLAKIVTQINTSPHLRKQIGLARGGETTAHQIKSAITRLVHHLRYEPDTVLLEMDEVGVRRVTEDGEDVLRWCERFAEFLAMKPPPPKSPRLAVAVGGSVLHDIVPALMQQLQDRGHAPSSLAFDTFVPRLISDQLLTRRVVMGVAWYGGETAGKEFAAAGTLSRVTIGAAVPVALLLPHDHPLAAGSPGSQVSADRLADQVIIYPPLKPLRRVARRVTAARRVRVTDLPSVARQVASGLGLGLYPAHPIHLRPAAQRYGLTWRELTPASDKIAKRYGTLQLCAYTSRPLADVVAGSGLSATAICAALKTVVEQSERREGGWHLEGGPATLEAGTFEWLDLTAADGRLRKYRLEHHEGTLHAVPVEGGTPFVLRPVQQAPTTVLVGSDPVTSRPLSLTFVHRARGGRGDQLCLCGGGISTTAGGALSPVAAALSLTCLTATDLAELFDLAPFAPATRAEK